MSNWKKPKGYADGGEIEQTVEDMKPAEGRFSADVYERARKFVEAGGKATGPVQEAPKSAPKPKPKVTDTGDESERLITRRGAPSPSKDADAPTPAKAEVRVGRASQARVAGSDPELDKPFRASNPMAGKAAKQQQMREDAPEGTGERIRDRLATGVAVASTAIPALRGLRAARASRQAEGIMESGAKRAAGERRMAEARARHAAQDHDWPVVDNYAKGGQVGKRPMKQHMKEEMAVLKRGGASKQLMAEERAEYGEKMAVGGVVGPSSHRDYGKK